MPTTGVGRERAWAITNEGVQMGKGRTNDEKKTADEGRES